VPSGHPIWSSWTQFGYTFQANSTSATIQFHQTGPSGSDDAAIDKVSIAQVGTTVPEPGTVGLAAAGLIGLVLLRRRRMSIPS
jgi:PEP-CTERM motif